MQPSFFRKSVKVLIVVLVVLGIGIYSFANFFTKAPVVPVAEVKKDPVQKVIGTSVEGRAIDSFTYGNGDTHVVFVGGMHGGYEWNSVYLAYRFIDYVNSNPEIIPENMKVTVIPSLNVDGVYRVTKKEGRFAVGDISTSTKVLEAARFNANSVDLNRNFDCKWKSESMWKGKKVSAGKSAFSEPEALALKSFVEESKPSAVIFWHSQANSVYASECTEGILPVTLDIMNEYAKASGYTPVKSFDAYAITGDAEGWLASIQIPAITVELKTHETIEWDKNLAGVKAFLEYFRK